jgi:hypothetical protein
VGHGLRIGRQRAIGWIAAYALALQTIAGGIDLTQSAALGLVLALPTLSGAVAGHAEGMMQTRMVGAYRVELHVLPAEPFFSKQDVADKHIKEGMEIEGGAAPVAPDAGSHPNHHMVVRVFGGRGGAVVTDAKVTMSFIAVDARGQTTGVPTDVPVVVMQTIGGGPASTHYGNNVTMSPGRYNVVVTVNDNQLVFLVTVSDAPAAPMKMDHMKM